VTIRRVRFSRHALQDIDEVLAHTLAQFGPRKFEEYQELIRQAMTDIAGDPNAHPARRRAEIHPDARTFHIGRRGKRARHFLLYYVASDQRIHIGRLLHDSMDLRRHLAEGFDFTSP
jgi:toxin ParE1/3/4